MLRWEIADAQVKPGIAAPVDLAGGGVFDVGNGPVGAVVEDDGADAGKPPRAVARSLVQVAFPIASLVGVWVPVPATTTPPLQAR